MEQKKKRQKTNNEMSSSHLKKTNFFIYKFDKLTVS